MPPHTTPTRPGKRMAFVGDDTWQQLSPGAFEWSWPYPSFNVKDLHSVDDGVWQVGVREGIGAWAGVDLLRFLHMVGRMTHPLTALLPFSP